MVYRYTYISGVKMLLLNIIFNIVLYKILCLGRIYYFKIVNKVYNLKYMLLKIISKILT